MNRFIQTLFRRMSECIKSFWVMDEQSQEAHASYKDYPVSPIGPARMISRETIADLMK